MADDSVQTGADTIATDHVTTLNGVAVTQTSTSPKVQRVKASYGDDGTSRDVSTSFPLPAVTPNSYTTGTISAANANQYIGTATANSSVVVTIPDGHSSWDVYINGTFSAGTTLQFQGSLDGTNWFSLNGRRNTDATTNDTTNFIATDFVGGASPLGGNPSNFRGVIGGIRFFRVTCVAYTASDSISVQISTSAGVGPTFLNNVPQFSLLDSSNSGSLTATGSVQVPSTGTGTVGVQVTGTFVASFVFEASNDGTNYFAVNGVVSGTGAQVSGASAPGQWRVNASGYAYTRVRVSSYTSGTVAIKLNGSSASGLTTMAEPLPAGTNSIGSVVLGGSGGLVQTSGAISAAVANTPGTGVTASTTAQIVAGVATAGNATFHVVAAAFVGTLTFEASLDAGLNYAPIMAIREDGTGSESSIAINTATTYIRQWTVAIPGLTYFRVRCSAFTSGTAAVVIAPGPFLIEPNPSLAAGSNTIGYTNPDVQTQPTGLAALNAAASITLNGHGTVVVQCTGTYSGTASFEVQEADGTWVSINGFVGLDGGRISGFFSAAGTARVVVSGMRAFRVRLSAYTSGTATISLNASYATTAPPTPAIVNEGSSFADQVQGTTMLARTAGSSSTALNRVPITDAAGQLVSSPVVQGLTATNTTTVPATPGATGTIGNAAATITAAVTTAAAFINAPGAGLSIYITDVSVANTGAAASVLRLFAGAATVPLWSAGVAVTTGFVAQSLRTPIRVGTATALNYTNSVASSNIEARVTYYIAV